MQQDGKNGGRSSDAAGPTGAGSQQVEPRWVTVVLIVAFLCLVAEPRTITTPGLSPILIVISAVVLVFWIFGRD